MSDCTECSSSSAEWEKFCCINYNFTLFFKTIMNMKLVKPVFQRRDQRLSKRQNHRPLWTMEYYFFFEAWLFFIRHLDHISGESGQSLCAPCALK